MRRPGPGLHADYASHENLLMISGILDPCWETHRSVIQLTQNKTVRGEGALIYKWFNIFYSNHVKHAAEKRRMWKCIFCIWNELLRETHKFTADPLGATNTKYFGTKSAWNSNDLYCYSMKYCLNNRRCWPNLRSGEGGDAGDKK